MSDFWEAARGWRVVSGLVLALLSVAPVGYGQSWTDDSFEDFMRGELDASGQNLYVTPDGTVRTIHRFDLNDSGYIDLVFANTHDTSAFHDATMAMFDAEGYLKHEPVSVRGSTAVEVADLNDDGFLDLVFLPNYSNIQNARGFLTIVYGGDDGWPAHRATGLLPVGVRPAGLAVGDFTGNGWPDLIALCQSDHPDLDEILRVFEGGEKGFSRFRFEDIPAEGAVALAGADFDGDGVGDVAFLTDDDELVVLWGLPEQNSLQDLPRTEVSLPEGTLSLAAGDLTGDGRPNLAVGTDRGVVHLVTELDNPDRPLVRTHEAGSATHLVIGDADADGRADLVATYLPTGVALGGEAEGAEELGQVTLFWGDGAGFSAERRTGLDVRYPRAAAVADMNGDGVPDVTVAVHQTEETFAAKSVVLIGEGGRRFARHTEGAPTTGATDVKIAPADERLPARAVFANSLGGTVGERVPVQIYWGGPDGFAPEETFEIPFVSGYEATAADFNANGHVDLLVINAGHGRQAHNPDQGANIFWGGKGDFSHDNKTVLSEEHLATSSVADLNRDGYLDIALGSFQRTDPDANHLAIYYGSKDGYTRENRVVLPMDQRSVGTVIADYNRDEWLDIAVTCYNTHRVFILWGSEDGFDSGRKLTLEVPAALGIETADLNASGFLDLIVGSYNDPVSGENDTGLFIFWGSEDGFSPFNAQWLPGMTPLGFTVADFDEDGYLDLFSPHYHANGRREALPSYLYWGGEDGFRPGNKTQLINDSADDSLAGDFNGNGLLDLAVANHGRHGDHETYSKIFYNDGNRFQDPEITKLPTNGAHWMYHQDTGHIYHRRWEQVFRSRIFEWAGESAEGKIEIDADVFGGSRLIVSVRSAPDAQGLSSAAWRAFEGGRFVVDEEDRLLQYQVKFVSDNGDRYPILYRVELSLE